MRPTAPILFAALVLIGCSGKPPPNLGARNGQLSPCPNKPNCVSSQSHDKQHYVAPFTFTVPSDVTRRALLDVLPHIEGAKVVTQESFYIRAEFSSKRMKFVDDVEFLIDPLSSVVHVRSASRLGYSDLGVNRKRVEEIRAQLAQVLAQAD